MDDMPYGTLIMDNGTKIFLEVEAPREHGQVSEKSKIVKGLEEQFSNIMNVVKETAQSAHAGYNSIPEEDRPKELEISFGMKLNAEAGGVVFAKVGCEGSFLVTLRWK